MFRLGELILFSYLNTTNQPLLFTSCEVLMAEWSAIKSVELKRAAAALGDGIIQGKFMYDGIMLTTLSFPPANYFPVMCLPKNLQTSFLVLRCESADPSFANSWLRCWSDRE